MAGVQFGNVGGNVQVETIAGRDIIQASGLQEKDKAELQGLSNQLEQTLETKKEGWQAKAEAILTRMVAIGKDVAIKVAVEVLNKRLAG